MKRLFLIFAIVSVVVQAETTEEKDQRLIDDISRSISTTVANIQKNVDVMDKKIYGAFENVEKWVQDLRNKLRADLANIQNSGKTLGEMFGTQTVPMNGWEFKLPAKFQNLKYRDFVRMMGALPPQKRGRSSFLDVSDNAENKNTAADVSDSESSSKSTDVLVEDQDEDEEKDEVAGKDKWWIFGPSEADRQKDEDTSKANAAQIKTLVAAGQIPESYDFFQSFPICRGKSLNQGSCGSCWAFSSALSSSYRICKKMVESNWTKIPKGFLISPQGVLSCTPAIVSQTGCGGGQTDFALSWISQRANSLDSCFGYDSWTGEANRDECPKEDKCAKFPAVNPSTGNVFGYVNNIVYSSTDLPTKVKNIQAAILADGPVSVTVRLASTFMGYSGKGVYRASPSDPLVPVGSGGHAYHAMTIFGWGVEPDGTKYWLVQNQWDEPYTWGMPKGYADCVKMVRGEDNSQIESILVAALTIGTLPAQNPFGGSAGTSANNTPFPAPASKPAPAAAAPGTTSARAGYTGVRSRGARSFLDISKDLSKLENDVEKLEELKHQA